MKYQKFQFLYPPRPENAIPSAMLTYYEGRKWLAQFKKNGTNTEIAISPDKQFFMKTRHNTDHKQWSLTPHIQKELIRLLPEKEWFVICCELLHNKTKEIKDTIYIFDVLVWKGEFLYDSTFAERKKLLDDRLITNVEAVSHYVCDNAGKIWYAKAFDKDFKALFAAIKDPNVDEGLVLKDPNGKLEACAKPTDNAHWQVKCRHTKKGYAF